MKENELRELDAWIAEHVMGVKVNEASWYCPYCRKEVSPAHVTFKEFHDSRFGGCDNKVHHDIPHYTTGPAAAFEVLKKCGENGLLNGDFKLPISIMRRGDLQWVISENAEDEPEDSVRHYIVVEAETLELAICLFAKKLFQKHQLE